MHRFTVFALILLVVLLLLDLYVFKAFKIVTADIKTEGLKKGLRLAYWAPLLLTIVYTVYVMANAERFEAERNTRHFFWLAGIIFMFLIPKLIIGVFHLIEDIAQVLRFGFAKLAYPQSTHSEGATITRWDFITKIGMTVGAIPFFGVLYGITKGLYDYRVINKTLSFANLPKAFDGFKIVQISDAHLGSFAHNPKPIEHAIKMINDLNADIVVFTGDLVNNYADEAEYWVEVFKGIEAKEGKYSILGNHDYAEYVKWNSEAEREENMQQLYKIHQRMGFDLLKNENRTFSSDGDELKLLGVENWGKPPFPQKGDLNKAMDGCTDNCFKVLLSHDPSHWDAQVLNKTNIDLTLSGHTHGMQFGLEIAGLKWSPVKYRYPRWGGLYSENNQHLYVNRGFGVIGFPGRVGMPPEITCLELKKG